jgi:hypothetical protein
MVGVAKAEAVPCVLEYVVRVVHDVPLVLASTKALSSVPELNLK